MWLLELQLNCEFEIKFEEHACRSASRLKWYMLEMKCVLGKIAIGG